MGNKKILVVLTSQGTIPNTDKPTGWYLPEFAHPYAEFAAAGYDITVASPKGGEAPLDPSSVEAFKSDPVATSFLEKNKSLWQSTAPLASFLGRAGDFDALFYPGGHGPMWDLAGDADSQALIAEFWTKDKVVAAVCHGPAVLSRVRLPGGSGDHLLKGKQVTGFSNAEEDQAGMTPLMPFMLEDALNEASGGKYVKADEPWAPKTVVEGKLVTGQNPASSTGVGQAIVKLLSA